MAYSEYFLEAVAQIANTDDTNSQEYQDALSMLEGTGTEKKELTHGMRSEILKWARAAKGRNTEIYNTKGDITQITPDIRETASTLAKGIGENGTKGVEGLREGLTTVSALYNHFAHHKDVYTKAFASKNETVIQIYVSSVWSMISYLAEGIVSAQGRKTAKLDKYGKWIRDLKKMVNSPKFVEYLVIDEKSQMNTESILYESGLLAAGATIVGGLTLARLIIWNMYNMRTKLSDKLKVTAEYMEKNAKRLSNTNRKNKDKIVARQLKSVDVMNRLSELFRIKTDEDKISSPPKVSAPAKKDDSSTSASDDDDFEL